MNETELGSLKDQAKIMGITFRDNIGITSLKAKIEAHKSGAPISVDDNPLVEPNHKDKEFKPRGKHKLETKRERQNRLRKESNLLVRINVTCMNPNMREHTGAIYTVSNSIVGTLKKFIPFNTTEGWHVPTLIYKHLLERKCQVFYNGIDDKGNKVRKGKLIPELSIQVLPNLTRPELETLAKIQAMENGQV